MAQNGKGAKGNDDIKRGNTGTGDQDRRDVGPHGKVTRSTGTKEKGR